MSSRHLRSAASALPPALMNVTDETSLPYTISEAWLSVCVCVCVTHHQFKTLWHLSIKRPECPAAGGKGLC